MTARAQLKMLGASSITGLLCVLALTSCSADADPADGPTSEAAAEQLTPATGAVGEPIVTPRNGDSMRVEIEVGDRMVSGTLNDSAASRDLLAQLPLTITLSDHGSVEKTGPLPAELTTEGSPSGADPNPGDIGYYSPGNDLVLYYGDQSYFPGIVILGSMDEIGPDVVGAIDGSVTVTVTRSDR
ncbi:hypothetical protein CH300_27685 [Rhodococcus sp. 15-1154-1]|nr:hypothetical protein CH300_27685 [Rhodococcus sp. 15-1154-1]